MPTLLHAVHFKDVVQAVTSPVWCTLVGLKDAYFHMPIAQKHQLFLRFAFQEESTSVLHPPIWPLSSSSCVQCVQIALTACRVPLFPCSVKDKLVLLYLDDWLLIAHSPEQMMDTPPKLLNHVTALGHQLSKGFPHSCQWNL